MMTLDLPLNSRTGWAALKAAAVAKGSRLLVKGALMRGAFAHGGTVHCSQGTLWITVDGSPEDIVLEAGEHRKFSTPVRFLAESLADAGIRIED
jgi:hypothetical protein